jgi:Flp pilus assembly protein TadG
MLRTIDNNLDNEGSGEAPGISAAATSRHQPTFVARFRANKRGAVAIEFALIALPFFLMMFAIIEISLSFAAQEVMANATDDVSRQLRTGQLKATNVSGTKLKTVICGKLLMPATG